MLADIPVQTVAQPGTGTGTRVVRGACPHDCPDTCALHITVQDGRVTRVQGDPDHPPTHGALCTKVSRYAERSYSPDRVLTPLKRVGKKGAGRFEPVSWDAALDAIAARLKATATRDPEAVLPYSYAGTMGLVQGDGMAARFFHKLGASLLDRTICSNAGGEALAATYGAKVGMHLAHFAESRLILIWGSNPITSSVHFWTFAQQAKRAGAKLVCIDPRRTDTADKCQQHIALLPGTDGALALGLMHELIAHQWLDQAYLDRHVEGWPALRDRALQWPAERAAAVCGITAGEVRQLARDYGTTGPAAIRLNYGMQRVRGGGNAVRLIALLPCLVGAWRHRAGGLLLSASGWFKPAVDGAWLQRPDSAGRSAAAHHQHGDDRRRPAAPRVGGLRPAHRSPRRLQQQPGGGGARQQQGGSRLCARRPLHRRAGTFPDRHRRPRRLRAAGHDAAGTLGRPPQLRPHLRAAERAGDRARRAGQVERRDLSPAGRAHGLHRALLQRQRRDHGTRCVPARAGQRGRPAGAGLGAAGHRRGTVRQRRFPHAQTARRWPMRRIWACPTSCRITRASNRHPHWRRAIRWR